MTCPIAAGIARRNPLGRSTSRRGGRMVVPSRSAATAVRAAVMVTAGVARATMSPESRKTVTARAAPSHPPRVEAVVAVGDGEAGGDRPGPQGLHLPRVEPHL